MDTQEFLEHILPDEGFIVLADFRTGEKFPKQHFYTSFSDAAEAVQALDVGNHSIFHACATYVDTESRKQSNVSLVKSFWLDIDIGKEDTYQSKKEASVELAAVCQKLNWPMPTIVSSGRGLHCYFTFTHAVKNLVWKAAAKSFRTALDAMEFKHDPARTTDQASVLRPVGSTWRKDGGIEVKLIKKGEHTDFDVLMKGLITYLGDNNLTAAPTVIPLFKVESLGVKSEYPPSSAHEVANKCPQLARMRDMKGSLPEPEWRNAIGVIKHCVEGDALAHEWSQGDSRYDEGETQTKIDSWTYGPTTCSAFAGSNPHVCKGCKFSGKVKSPIQLGYTSEVEAPPELAQPESEKLVVDHMQYWPQGFRWDEPASRMMAIVRDEDGVAEWVDFCDTLFYPTTRVEMEDGTRAMRYKAQVSKGTWREFEIPTKLNASVEMFTSALASYEVMIIPKKGHLAVAYTNSWLGSYKKAGVEMATFKHYGWHNNYETFLLGDQAINVDGSEHTVIRASNITKGSKLDEPFTNFKPEGSASEWGRIFCEIYNRPNTEHYQFVSLALMASPLVGLFDVTGWHGIPVAMTGEGGHGKTAVGRAACSIYGKGDSFVFQANSATSNAFDPFVAGLRNLPCVFDELTGRDPKQVSDKLYGLSNGGARMRADQRGNLSSVNHKWDMIGQINGNTNITESMRLLEKTVSDASSVRIFEINVGASNGSNLFDAINVPKMLEELEKHYGHVGRMLLKASMAERIKLREAFLKMRSKLGYESPNYDPRERFYIDLIATALIAGQLLKNMGIINFDLNRIKDWSIAHIMEMRIMRQETTYSVDEQVASLLSSLGGHILATKHINKTGVELPMDAFRINGSIHARLVLGANEERLIVSSRVVDEWCTKNGVQPRIFRKNMKESGYLKAGASDRFTLSQGTNIPSTRERVLEFVYSKVSGATNVITEPNSMTALA